jgi:exonuclease III
VVWFPGRGIEAAGCQVLWKGQPSHQGVAILSRGAAPRKCRRNLPGDDSDEQARYLEADVHGITVACVYLPNGNPQDQNAAGGESSKSDRRPRLTANDVQVPPLSPHAASIHQSHQL